MASLVLNLRSSWVNAFLFIFDILYLWAVHRGLNALQGWCMYCVALRDQRVPIARSRFSVVSGELLRRTTRSTSVFVPGIITVIVGVFFATAGVNGDQSTSGTRRSLRTSVPFRESSLKKHVWSPLHGCFHRHARNEMRPACHSGRWLII